MKESLQATRTLVFVFGVCRGEKRENLPLGSGSGSTGITSTHGAGGGGECGAGVDGADGRADGLDDGLAEHGESWSWINREGFPMVVVSWWLYGGWRLWWKLASLAEHVMPWGLRCEGMRLTSSSKQRPVFGPFGGVEVR